jgi:pimeloyl-ACP methyl ester carboxylesterase
MIAPISARRWAATAIAVSLMLAATAAVGQSRQELLERFREECSAQFAYLRGPGQHEIVHAHVHGCVIARMDSAIRQRSSQTPSGGAPLQLIEATPWLVKNAGPEKAKGVIYFVRGYTPYEPSRDDFAIPPYFLKSLNAAGWDVIQAKVPHSEPDSELAAGLRRVGRTEPFVRERLAALKKDGYRKVVLGGHSWGGWLAMLLAHDAVADAVILSAPNAFGQRTAPTGRANAVFGFTVTQFAAPIGAVKIPAVVILPEDTVYDANPGERGRIAEQRLAAAGVPHLVIAEPPGFEGHYAGWLPFFDFAYGECIEAFLETPSAPACAPPPRRGDDFRAILNLKEVADADKKRIVSTQALAGKKFTVYTLEDEDNKHFDYVSANQRVVLESTSENRETVTFRDGLQCIAGACRVLIAWSDREVLEFDPKSGELRAWWVEDN